MNLLCRQLFCLFFITFYMVTFANNHELTIERINLIYLNKSVVDVNCTINRISHTEYGVSLYINYFRDEINDDDVIVMQLYSLHNNEYRLAPARVVRKTCQFLNMEWKFINVNMNQYGNMPTSCPIKKGLYYIKDCIMDGSNMSDLPWDNMRIDTNFTYQNKVTASAQIYLKIDRNSKFVNKFLSQL